MTSKPFKGITLSRLFTGNGRVQRDDRGGVDKLTVEAADYRFSICALLDDKLDVWVCAGDLGKVIAEEGARVGGRGPLFAELEDELADLGDECDVTVCGARGQLPAEKRPCWEQLGCHRGRAEESRCVRVCSKWTSK